MNYRDIITIEPGKRGGKPCIRGMRITVYDVLEYLAAGMTHQEILEDFPYLKEEDILACLSYAADREKQMFKSLSANFPIKSSFAFNASYSRCNSPTPITVMISQISWNDPVSRFPANRLSRSSATTRKGRERCAS